MQKYKMCMKLKKKKKGAPEDMMASIKKIQAIAFANYSNINLHFLISDKQLK